MQELFILSSLLGSLSLPRGQLGEKLAEPFWRVFGRLCQFRGHLRCLRSEEDTKWKRKGTDGAKLGHELGVSEDLKTLPLGVVGCAPVTMTSVSTPQWRQRATQSIPGSSWPSRARTYTRCSLSPRLSRAGRGSATDDLEAEHLVRGDAKGRERGLRVGRRQTTVLEEDGQLGCGYRQLNPAL